MNKVFFFIDESGDPTFYGTRKKLLVDTVGFQPYLIIGLIETKNRRSLRKAVLDFTVSIKNDTLYNSIPSIASEKEWFVHARSDHPEIRAKFFETLRQLEGYTAHIVIAHKNLEVFTKKHNSNESEFYFDVLHHLIKERLTEENVKYHICLSKRGNNSMFQFTNAVEKALSFDSKKRGTFEYSLEILSSSNTPELSIVDYLIWSIQRKLLKDESRFFDALKEKFGTVIELYGNSLK